MTLKGPEFKKALLLGLIAATVPLFYYPRTFGWAPLGQGGARLLLVEWVYYILVFRSLFPRESISHRLGAAGTAFAFRLSLGFVWSVLASGLFDIAWGQAIQAGLYGYLPTACLHMLLVPFLLRASFRFRELRRRPSFEHAGDFSTPVARKAPPPVETTALPAGHDARPDFDAAVAHVAGYSAVQLALLVDEEGLPVARASRSGVDHELWAPMINLIYAAVTHELRRAAETELRRFDLLLAGRRIIVERVSPFYFAVLVEEGTDDLVNVRIAQAVEMVKRYYQQKYTKVASSALQEVAYV